MRSLYTYVAWALGTIACAALLLWLSAREDPVRFFSHELAAAHMDMSVSVEATVYAVRDGAVFAEDGARIEGKAALKPLSLAYETSLARRNPLFAIAGVSPQELRSAVLRLKETSDALASLQSSGRDAELVRSSLYPTAFLLSLADAEEARLALIATSTDENGRRYTHALENTSRTYNDSLSAYTSGFKTVVPEDAAAYVTTGGRVTRASTVETLDMLHDRAQELARKLSQRSSCLSGRVHACEEYALTLNIPTRSISLTTYDPTTLEGIYRVLDGAADEFYRQMRPAVALEHSRCIESAGTAPLFSLTVPTTRAPDQLRPWVEYIGDIFLVDTSTQSFPFFSYFSNAGVSYTPHSPMSTYACVRLLTDASKVLFTTKMLGATSSPILYERDARNTLAARAASATTSIRDIEEDIVAYTGMSSALSALIDRLSYEREADMRIRERGVHIDMSAVNLFYIQSAFYSLFLADNPFVTGASPFGLLRPADLSNTPLLRWSQHTDIPAQALIRDFSFFIRAH